MNTLLETRGYEAETVDLCRDDVALASVADRNSLNQNSPVPLWLEATAQAFNFRHRDLVRTHWKKIGRSMLDD